jgi:DNA-binding winged helix-turn-helix (wHTH) protein/TolB-like protein
MSTGASIKKHTFEAASKLSPVRGNWLIIGLLEYWQLLPTFLAEIRKRCRADNRKIIGKDLEKANGNKTGASTNGQRYVFDGFEIDPVNRTCVRDGTEIQLTSRVFDILLVFAENPGRLLEKDELIEKVWHGDFVEDGNLARNVSFLRKALGDGAKEPKYIVTVQGHGYRFLADVAEVSKGNHSAVAQETAQLSQVEKILTPVGQKRFSRKWLWAIPIAASLIAAGWIYTERVHTAAGPIKSLAVLPLKSLDSNEKYLGAGIADAVIRRISQTGQLTVRPTSAVLKYAKEDTDSLAVARQLNADAVLEGSVQRANDRLRVTVNLLRTSDGASLWTDSFDMPASDIFVIQDKVAQQVAMRLELRLDSTQPVGLNSRYPTNPIAYEFYIKGIFSLDERGYGEESMSQMNDTIGFFKEAIEIDPKYALAHAQLAFAYAWTALFIKPAESKWADLARAEINQATDLNPNLAETHIAHALMLWSSYEGFQNAEAIRELRLARQLNPNNVSPDLPALYGHVGLDDLAAQELKRAMEINPTSQSLKDLTTILPYLREDADEFWAAREKLGGGLLYAPPWYYLRKGRLDVAQKSIDQRLPKAPRAYNLLINQGLLFALKGDFQEAQSKIPGILATVPLSDQGRHHSTYDAACIYALAGNSNEAVRWLKETAATGFPNYPLFARDPYLDRIRKAPEFVQFMADQKAQWEKYRQEFGD